MLKCHCRDCQRFSGGPYTPVVVPFAAFKITQGEIQRYGTPSLAVGHNVRGFCPQCRSRVTGAESVGKGIIGQTASSLDDPGWSEAKLDLYVSDAQPWEQMDADLPKFPHYMPRGS
jgi:hypothetical protein